MTQSDDHPRSQHCAWLEAMGRSDAASYRLALARGVRDEDSYLRLESTLPVDLRMALGTARLLHQCRAKAWADIWDVFAALRHAPPWCRALPLEVLDLPARPQNALSGRGVFVLGDMARFTRDEVMTWKNFGAESLKAIEGEVVRVFKEGLRALHVRAFLPPDDPASSITYGEAMKVGMQRLDEQRRQVMQRRMRRESLQEIGDSMGFVRERVRQLEADALVEMKKIPFFKTTMGRRLQQIRGCRENGLPLAGLEVLEPEMFSGASANLAELEYVLEKLVTPAHFILNIRDVFYVTDMNRADWDAAVRDARKSLEQRVKDKPVAQEVEFVVRAYLGTRAPELGGEFWNTVQESAYIVDGRLVATGLRGLVAHFLAQADEPLHWTVLVEQVRREAPNAVAGTVRNLLSEEGLLFGRGRYGTSRHLGLSDEMQIAIADAVVAHVQEDGSERQWHAAEFCQHLVETGVDAEGTLDMYVVSICLRLKRPRDLEDLGRGAWRMKSSGAEDVGRRIELHDAIVRVLEQSAGPLTSDQIRSRLQEAGRGLNHLFQIHPKYPLVRVSPGHWGLITRDVALSADLVTRLMAALKAVLERRQSGIHASEIANLLPGAAQVADVQLLIEIARDHPGHPELAVAYGEYVYLKEWGSPRRATLFEAVEQVLAAGGAEGVSVDEGKSEAARLLGRPWPDGQDFVRVCKRVGGYLGQGRWRVRDVDDDA